MAGGTNGGNKGRKDQFRNRQLNATAFVGHNNNYYQAVFFASLSVSLVAKMIQHFLLCLFLMQRV